MLKQDPVDISSWSLALRTVVATDLAAASLSRLKARVSRAMTYVVSTACDGVPDASDTERHDHISLGRGLFEQPK